MEDFDIRQEGRNKEKDFEKEAALEAVLKNNGLTYYKEENYISSENMWQIAYEMEVIINGE